MILCNIASEILFMWYRNYFHLRYFQFSANPYKCCARIDINYYMYFCTIFFIVSFMWHKTFSAEVFLVFGESIQALYKKFRAVCI